MNAPTNLFTDGKAYERLMGRWSQVAGAKFLDWLDAAKRPALDRCRLRQRRLYRSADCARCAVSGDRHRSFGRPDRLRAHAAGNEARAISRRRCAGLAVRRQQFRRSIDGAGHHLPERPGESCARNGARGQAGRHRRHLYVGHSGRRLSDQAALRGHEILGSRRTVAAECRSVTAREHARVLATGGNAIDRHHSDPHPRRLCRFRRFLGFQQRADRPLGQSAGGAVPRPDRANQSAPARRIADRVPTAALLTKLSPMP